MNFLSYQLVLCLIHFMILMQTSTSSSRINYILEAAKHTQVFFFFHTLSNFTLKAKRFLILQFFCLVKMSRHGTGAGQNYVRTLLFLLFSLDFFCLLLFLIVSARYQTYRLLFYLHVLMRNGLIQSHFRCLSQCSYNHRNFHSDLHTHTHARTNARAALNTIQTGYKSVTAGIALTIRKCILLTRPIRI